MLIDSTRRVIAFFTSLAFLFTMLIGGANAAMVGTESAVSAEQRADRVSEIQSWMMQGEVQEQLVAMGVEPADAAERVAGMTDAELRMLHGKIESLPAGAGAIEVIGIVFVVLLILELVGVTNIFAHF